MIIGAQMFTVRNFTDTLPELADTLARIADIGYTTVQLSATCPYEPEWMDEQLKKNGLTCKITHYNFDRIMNDTSAVIAEHKAFGCKYIGMGSVPDEAVLDEKGHKAAKLIADSGMLLMFHNHDKEYTETRDGKSKMLYYADAFAPGEMGFTLDLYWAEYAGHSAADELKRLSGRVPVIHYKDLVVMPDGEKRFAPVGSGILDFEKITEAAIAAGTEAAFVEQDNCYGENPFECLKKSYDYLKSIGLS